MAPRYPVRATPEGDLVYRTRSGEQEIESGGSSDPLLLGNGSAAAPTYAFTSDPDTGMYRIGANRLGLATGGTARWEIDASGNLMALTNGADVILRAEGWQTTQEFALATPAGHKYAGLVFTNGGTNAFDGSIGMYYSDEAEAFWYCFGMDVGQTQLGHPLKVTFRTDNQDQWIIDATGKLKPQQIANTVAAAATDAASTQALANSIRTLLINLGILDAA